MPHQHSRRHGSAMLTFADASITGGSGSRVIDASTATGNGKNGLGVWNDEYAFKTFQSGACADAGPHFRWGTGAI